MRKRISLNEPDIVNNQKIITSGKSIGLSGELVNIRPFKVLLEREGREDFFNYIEWLGLDTDPNPVVISSIHHYYYDADEMKSVNTLVNLTQLNQIKEISEFLVLISGTLPFKSNLVGCFTDNKKRSIFMVRDTSSSMRVSAFPIVRSYPGRWRAWSSPGVASHASRDRSSRRARWRRRWP